MTNHLKELKKKMDAMSTEELQEVADLISSMNIGGPTVDEYMDNVARGGGKKEGTNMAS